ncbi:MAG: helix-turn-helix transcriptional regulator [Planctomycetota bacterium]
MNRRASGNSRRLISVKAAAEILAVSPKTIYSWAYARNGPRLEFVKLGRSLRVVEDSVYALIEHGRLPEGCIS